MEPFTLNQAAVAALLFLLGILIGMFFLATPKWKRRYKAERALVAERDREIERLHRENREYTTLRAAADRHPGQGAYAPTPTDRDGDGIPDHRERGIARDRDRDGTPDVIDRRP